MSGRKFHTSQAKKERAISGSSIATTKSAARFVFGILSLIFLLASCSIVQVSEKKHNHILFVSSFTPPAITTKSYNNFLSSVNKQTFPFSPLHKDLELHKVKPKSSTSSSSLYSLRAGATYQAGINSHHLVRIIFLRALSFVYSIAFLVAYHQNKALIGDNGITPAKHTLDNAQQRGKMKRRKRQDWIEYKKKNFRDHDKFIPDPEEEYKIRTRVEVAVKNSKLYRFMADQLNSSNAMQNVREKLWDRADALGRPLISLLWLCKDRSKLNRWLDGIALTGLFTSLSILYMGAANVPMLLLLWLCQRSLMSVGGPWYGYGWEPQLAELNFHALFLVPFLSLDPITLSAPVPNIVIWCIRWYLFRIMLGAGLIKIRSNDPKWTKTWSTMEYFYLTQPVPNFFTKYFHFMPKWWHKFEVGSNHFVELIAPWLMMVPGGGVWGRMCRISGGVIQIMFQMILISSGNLSFLNWLTAVPALFCFDDAFVAKFFEPFKTTSASLASYLTMISTSTTNAASVAAPIIPITRRITTILFGSLIFWLSIPVAQNLLSKRQLMNASFDKLRLVNSYGAFGVVSEERVELIVSAAEDIDGPWKEYEFQVKPGDVYRRPRWISPYHYRLDWQMWIASACRSVERSPWMYSFLLKLLQQDEGVMGLLANDPWAKENSNSDQGQSNDKDQKEAGNNDAGPKEGAKIGKPRYIRVDKYKYNFYRPQKGGEKKEELGNDDTDKNKSLKPYWVREYVGKFYPKQGVASEQSLMELTR